MDLNLPELLTIDDLFSPMDFAYPMTQQLQITADQTNDLDDDWTIFAQPSTE